MTKRLILILLAFAMPSAWLGAKTADPWATSGSVLLDQDFTNGKGLATIELGRVAALMEAGLTVAGDSGLVKVNRFYALAQRSVKYLITPGATSVIKLQSSTGDFVFTLDIARKQAAVNSAALRVSEIPFLRGGRDVIVEIIHDYQNSTVKISDAKGRKSISLSLTNSGMGGYGHGMLQSAQTVGTQKDYYMLGLESGDAYVVKRLMVTTPRKAVKLLIYGDSITQPEDYFPSSMFSKAWTQRLIAALGGDAVSSGRGGCTIDAVAEYIRNELPYIKAKYVMVTIGTNGGNTEEKLTDLCNYIKSQGATPILNNIPSNESGTQVAVNAVIDKVRRKLGINGARLDLATSLNGDGREVDKSMMFWEDYPKSMYNGWQVYHHPNDKGGKAIVERIKADVPELFAQ